MRRKLSLASRLDVAALVTELEAIFADSAIRPEEAARRIALALRCGGRRDGGFSRREFLDLLAENCADLSATILTNGALGHWETGRSIISEGQLGMILRTYSALGLPDNMPLVSRIKQIRDLAEAERYKNKKVLSSLFQPRDLPKLQHAELSDPANDDGETYTYWTVDCGSADRDLDDFVTLSEKEVHIVGAHPDLTPHARRALYKRWLRRSPFSFMSLRKYDPVRGVAPVVAVSIMLPLRAEAAARVWNREVDAVDLADHDLYMAGAGEPLRILLDTWIVKREDRKESGIDYMSIYRRVDHEGFGGMLIPLHAGLFWDGAREATFLVEPDSTKIMRLCARLGFEHNRSQSKINDKGCYRLAFKKDACPALEAQGLMSGYVRDLRGVPVRNTPVSGPRQ